jgi:hypothetical protein
MKRRREEKRRKGVKVADEFERGESREREERKLLLEPSNVYVYVSCTVTYVHNVHCTLYTYI